ncbi:Fic family protein [Lacinutrix jangbogonensis]|uniref:Fic family protein n=1 Tax=Lacinutrix jangbogonensis TaxID=1469557 RepID=UPI00053D14E1|nr:Fic family protein [Lacinutrix jangbogonensis]
MLSSRESKLLEYIRKNPMQSSKEIHDGLQLTIGYATTKRSLTVLINKGLITIEGQGKGTKYKTESNVNLLNTINPDSYFETEIDDRDINNQFNFKLISQDLKTLPLFTTNEIKKLHALQNTYLKKSSQLSYSGYQKELERLAIDLSWKSSQIEGNTYTLLETELLLKEQQTAQGKTRDDATMLLNHKTALDFIFEHPDYLEPLTKLRLEDIHSLLIKELGVETHIRNSRVGISGTNYKPLDNAFQITEAIEAMCKLIQTKQSVFEKAFLALLLISYIQPFEDGNKRTARIVSNAILINNNYCPISFRTVDSIDYKKAMLIFYEQNNISAMKSIFINQFEFAVDTYF